jgi:hypothetical protein
LSIVSMTQGDIGGHRNRTEHDEPSEEPGAKRGQRSDGRSAEKDRT